MLPGDAGQPPDGVGIDADQACGAANATALVEVLEHGQGILLGEMAVEQGRALAFGAAIFARLAVEHADVILLAVAGVDREIDGVREAMEGTHRVLTAEAGEVIHAEDRSRPKKSDEATRHKPSVATILHCSPVRCSVILRHDRELDIG